jgi:hypothetical protein
MYTFHSSKWWHDMCKKTCLVDVTCTGDVPDGKALWILTADYDLLDADSIEGFPSLIQALNINLSKAKKNTPKGVFFGF